MSVVDVNTKINKETSLSADNVVIEQYSYLYSVISNLCSVFIITTIIGRVDNSFLFNNINRYM